MRRAMLALFAAFALLAGLTVSAGAQADAGNDGIDTDCTNNFFTSQPQAQDYFVGDGGSKERNVDDLDRDNNGVACQTGIRDVGGNGSQFPGDSGDDGTDDGAVEEDDSTDEEATGDGGDDGTDDGAVEEDDSTDEEATGGGGSGDDGEVSEVPATGAGPLSSGSDSMLLVTALGGMAALLGFAGLHVRKQA